MASYYAIIPANVRYDKNLIPNAKLLYGEITALCNEKGYCWAGNEYFSELYGVSKVSISKWVKSLVDGGYIESSLTYKEGTKQIDKRYITIVNDPHKEKLSTSQTKVNDPHKEKFKDNTTVNNTSNNTSNISNSPSQSKIDKYDEENDYFKLANLLYKKILKNNDKFIKPNLQNWADDIRKLNELDGVKNVKLIQDVIVFSQMDDFWKSNILSGKKVREKFNQLTSKMNRVNSPKEVYVKKEFKTKRDLEIEKYVNENNLTIFDV